MKKKNTQKAKKGKKGKNINLDSSSESEIIVNKKSSYPKKKNIKIKEESPKKKNLLGVKHKLFETDESHVKIKKKKIIEIVEEPEKNKQIKQPRHYPLHGSLKVPKNIQKKEDKKKEKKITKKNIKKDVIMDVDEEIDLKEETKFDDEDIIEFPYEYTQKVIDALTCGICKGIYVRPYVINIKNCWHVFCLGCILRCLENQELGICPQCKTLFNENNIKYSDVTDDFLKIFFPQYQKTMQEYIKSINDFMETEKRKGIKSNSEIDGENIELICELKPFKENVSLENRLGELNPEKSKIKLIIRSESDNIVKQLKDYIIQKLNTPNLNENNLEIRLQGIEISEFRTFEEFKNLIEVNLKEIITFFYSKTQKY